jgi:hypothetical protein
MGNRSPQKDGYESVPNSGNTGVVQESARKTKWTCKGCVRWFTIKVATSILLLLYGLLYGFCLVLAVVETTAGPQAPFGSLFWFWAWITQLLLSFVGCVQFAIYLCRTWGYGKEQAPFYRESAQFYTLSLLFAIIYVVQIAYYRDHYGEEPGEEGRFLVSEKSVYYRGMMGSTVISTSIMISYGARLWLATHDYRPINGDK